MYRIVEFDRFFQIIDLILAQKKPSECIKRFICCRLTLAEGALGAGVSAISESIATMQKQ